MHRILIIDDQPVFRQGLVSLLSAQADMLVCAHSEDFQQAVPLIEANRPDMVILSLCVDPSNAMQTIRYLHANRPQLPVLVISQFDEALYAQRVIRAGASGFVGRNTSIEGLLMAVSRLLSGKLYLSDGLSDHFLSLQMRGHSALCPPEENCLSNREIEVFALLGQGLSTRRIARQLHLSSKTIDTHKEHIKTKLGVTDNTALIQRAVIWLMEQQPQSTENCPAR
ncbi:response regulator transcription factor [Bowmanella dokdonensis]|uniref:Response regulator transcription factor n=1 Tax=Bowmanella dokdonensis TaxID=751969 RepID=A0A939ISB8_9ALTE|nr:response regulator transcription factor [Bowmanella dokdonensis]MBN7826562.1 response regulator transcription factor [Bowmanella dokdonensis]